MQRACLSMQDVIVRIQKGHFPCRFAENPLVQNEPFIRFYAGAPLITSTGHRLGSLCIIDRKPRELLAESCNVLINLAEIVVRELEKEQMRVSSLQNLAQSGINQSIGLFSSECERLLISRISYAMTMVLDFFQTAQFKTRQCVSAFGNIKRPHNSIVCSLKDAIDQSRSYFFLIKMLLLVCLLYYGHIAHIAIFAFRHWRQQN